MALAVGVLDCVTELSCAISRFNADYKPANADLEITRQQMMVELAQAQEICRTLRQDIATEPFVSNERYASGFPSSRNTIAMIWSRSMKLTKFVCP